MATLLTTRYWGSDESFSCFSNAFTNKLTKPEKNPNSENSLPVSDQQSENISPKQPTKRKATNVSSKLKAIEAYNDIFLEPSHVKASALLYEITDRTNQLAQPRIRNTEEKLQTRPNPSQISKASPRIIELSKPRVPYQYPHKQIGYVAPSALMAVATQRIIELSKPKKRRKLKMPSKRKSKLHKEKSRSYVKRGKKKSDHKCSSLLRDRKVRSKKKQLRTSDSDRTIIVVGLKMKDERKARRHS
ncbi:uncharacterized protein LOC122535393 isoform X1 [Frieseomelitta varia]|uniref:uncharacterized protein LOC122535393 isoform X1 n=1 Tax=Frieseomelitta varia TaxID=561572 RepID=UPI001CB68C33|nr:uncharacterized protein LOC122535393 isoform X1 [Frieseomelitta varia]